MSQTLCNERPGVVVIVGMCPYVATCPHPIKPSRIITHIIGQRAADEKQQRLSGYGVFVADKGAAIKSDFTLSHLIASPILWIAVAKRKLCKAFGLAKF
jgi:hypothetical protein